MEISQSPNVFQQPMLTRNMIVPATSIGQEAEDKPVIVTKRKCVDFFCNIFFLAFWGVCAFIIIWTKAWQNLSKADVLFMPHDSYRRICSKNKSEQLDYLSTDWSQLLTNPVNFKQFCEDSKKVFSHTYDCNTTFASNVNLSTIREYFANMSEYGKDMMQYQYGFAVNQKVICVNKNTLNKTEKNNFCNPPNDAAFVCQKDFFDFYNKINTSTSTLNPAPTSQFITQQQYSEMQQNIAPESQYIFDMCYQLNSANITAGQLRNDYDVDSTGQILGYITCVQKLTSFDITNISGSITLFINNLASNLVGQIKLYWQAIVLGMASSIILLIVYLLFLRFLLSFLLWSTIIGLILANLVCGGVCIFAYYQLKKQNQLRFDYFGYTDSAVSTRMKWYLAFGCIFLIIGAVLILLVSIFGKTIRICIGVIKQTIACIQRVPYIFIFPIFSIIFICGHLCWSSFFAYMLYLNGSYDARSNIFNFTQPYRNAQWQVEGKFLYIPAVYFAIIVFGAIWGIFFFYHLLEYNISSVVTQWYFTRDRSRKGLRGTLCRSVKFGILNIGTVIAASFVTTLVVFIRLIFEYIMKRIEAGNKAMNNKIVKTCICCARCCLKCLQKFLMWINRNVQIYASITGKGYCRSIGGAMKLLMAKFFSNLFGKGLTIAIIFLGKLIISLGSGCVCGLIIYFYKGAHVIGIIPSAVSAIGSFIICYYVLEVVRLVIDTIYMCFLYESVFMLRERESGVKPYAPADLAKLF